MHRTLVETIQQAAESEDTTIHHLLLASFLVLLARYSDTAALSVKAMYHEPHLTEVDEPLKLLPSVVKVDVSGTLSFREALAQVSLEARGIYDPVNSPKVGAGDDATIGALFSFSHTARFVSQTDTCAALSLQLAKVGTEIVGRSRCPVSLFHRSTIANLHQHWVSLLEAALREPARSIWSLQMMTFDEEQWLSRTLNNTQTPVPLLCAHDLFLRNAILSPDRIAVSFQGQSLSYGQLEARSAFLARQILDLGLGTELVVGVLVERSLGLVVALLGILRAGATYLPLDPLYPNSRLEHMVSAAGARLLITGSSPHPLLKTFSCPCLIVAGDGEAACSEPASGLELPEVDCFRSAYVIFTSGSTGVPKGVEISHQSLTNFLLSMQHRPAIKPNDILLAITSICFDISALELFLPLISGARIELASTEDAADPVLLRRRLRESGATIMQATPTTWRMLLDSGWMGSDSITILCGGEALHYPLANQLLQRANSVWNMYGPTEATIWCACAEVSRSTNVIVLGEPIDNTQLYVLGNHQELLPAGLPGELYIGGAGLAKGYSDQPELTTAQFPHIALGEREPIRLYRTGDRVKRHSDGTITFIGRTDGQIKLNGFRIEVGEIEELLTTLPGVKQSIVIKSHHPSRGEILVAFVVPKVGSSVRLGDLRIELGRSLPKFMQPSLLRIIKEVPLTLNGKLDRNGLSSLLLTNDFAGTQKARPGSEELLSKLWCSLVQSGEPGRGDNFFEHGGNSLLAIRFLTLANRAFGENLLLSSFIQAPTIAQFANLLRGSATPETQLLKLGTHRTKLLLWIGAEPWLTRLLPHLHEDLSLYTLTLSASTLASGVPGQSIQSSAAELIVRIRDLQPSGPYLLGGFCLSGLLAYEVAQQLQQMGQEVGLLVLVDVYAPGRAFRGTLLQRAIRRVRRETLSAMTINTVGLGRGLDSLRQRFRASQERRTFTKIGNRSKPRELQQALYSAERSYKAGSFRGKVLFFESKEEASPYQRTSMSWIGLIDDLEFSGILAATRIFLLIRIWAQLPRFYRRRSAGWHPRALHPDKQQTLTKLRPAEKLPIEQYDAVPEQMLSSPQMFAGRQVQPSSAALRRLLAHA